MQYKIIPGFNKYVVYEDGTVYSLYSKRLLKYQWTEDGYPKISLTRSDGKRQTVRVHQLVAKTFLPNPKNLPEVNHQDGDKSNNHYSNLEWSTHSNNIAHAWKTGLIKNTKSRSEKLSKAHKGQRTGKLNPRSRVVVLVNTGQIFESAHLAAKYAGIDQGAISVCCLGVYGRKSAGKDKLTKEPLVWRYQDVR